MGQGGLGGGGQESGALGLAMGGAKAVLAEFVESKGDAGSLRRLEGGEHTPLGCLERPRATNPVPGGRRYRGDEQEWPLESGGELAGGLRGSITPGDEAQVIAAQVEVDRGGRREVAFENRFDRVEAAVAAIAVECGELFAGD